MSYLPEYGPRRSARLSRPPNRYDFSHTSFNTTLSSISIPTCFSEAVEYEYWWKVMDEELRALQDNHTWDVYKAGLVALGNRQEYGVDYKETFAPVAKMTTMRTDLISLAGLQDSSSVDTPMEVNVKYQSEEGDLSDPTVFRQLVSQFMQTPRHLHLPVVRRIIRYLRGSPSHGLFFPTSSPLRLFAYSDADWAGCPDTRQSVTGWCMFLGNTSIAWKSKKQARVSKSSTESEYRAMSTTCSEIV
ncbi:uncharacterized mitochondrial protein AtMg00810-like [Corylus avellana]|uniref:uncharacterized mitochondrial protein AtMg00810-like n=1 Tax=Corylus avellana TaxID=13451 RepID=UPI00286A05BE|nr:uncharacterized mitochondrial protein AtMg00810-like [Corylus avellana]